MFRCTRAILFLLTGMVLLDQRFVLAKPQRFSNQPHSRRSTSENVVDHDVVSAPFSPASSRDNVWTKNEKPSEWADHGVVDQSEDSMAAPNFHTSKVTWNKNRFRSSPVKRSSSARKGPYHQVLYSTKPSSKESLKKHRRRSFTNSKEGTSVSPSKIAATLGTISQDHHHQGSPANQNRPETLPTPLPAAGVKPSPTNNTPTTAATRKEASKALTVRKRSESKSNGHEEHRRLISELGEILKDDDKESKRIPPDVKRQASFEEAKVEAPSESAAKESEKTGRLTALSSKSDRKAFDEWLRNEYFRNMALSMSTAKRKRNSPTKFGSEDSRTKRTVNLEFEEPEFDTEGDEGDFEMDKPLRNSVDDDVKTVLPADFDPETVQRRLQMLENAVLTEAVEKIVERARDSAMAEAAKEQVAQRLAEAFYLEKLQEAIEDKFSKPNAVAFRQKKPSRIPLRNTIEESDDEGDDNREEDAWRPADRETSDFDDEGPIKRGNLAEALNGMSSSDMKRRQVDCPELRLMTSDCSSLNDILPPDTSVSPELKHTCNKHEVCYTCGEAFGLTASICDVQFLRETAQICSLEGDKCEPHDLTKILAPLRERRVFYKRSINPLCYKAHVCIGRFLTEP